MNFKKCKTPNCENHTAHVSQICMVCWSDVSDIEKRLAAVSAERDEYRKVLESLDSSCECGMESCGSNLIRVTLEKYSENT